MNIVVKELKDENHIYLMDVNMRPCSVDVVTKDQTTDHVKDLIKKNSISNISVMDSIDLSKRIDYIIDHRSL